MTGICSFHCAYLETLFGGQHEEWIQEPLQRETMMKSENAKLDEITNGEMGLHSPGKMKKEMVQTSKRMKVQHYSICKGLLIAQATLSGWDHLAHKTGRSTHWWFPHYVNVDTFNQIVLNCLFVLCNESIYEYSGLNSQAGASI